MFSRQSGDIPGDSTFDISAGLIVGGGVSNREETLCNLSGLCLEIG